MRVEWRAPGPPTPDELGQAAGLCAFGGHSDQHIAQVLGISRRTLARWKHRADYQAAYLAAVNVRDRFTQWHLEQMRRSAGPRSLG